MTAAWSRAQGPTRARACRAMGTAAFGARRAPRKPRRARCSRSWAAPSPPASSSRRSSIGEDMPAHEAERAGIGAAVGDVAESARSIARLEARLAAAELKEKVGALAVGIGAGVTAGIL